MRADGCGTERRRHAVATSIGDHGEEELGDSTEEEADCLKQLPRHINLAHEVKKIRVRGSSSACCKIDDRQRFKHVLHNGFANTRLRLRAHCDSVLSPARCVRPPQKERHVCGDERRLCRASVEQKC